MEREFIPPGDKYIEYPLEDFFRHINQCGTNRSTAVTRLLSCFFEKTVKNREIIHNAAWTGPRRDCSDHQILTGRGFKELVSFDSLRLSILKLQQLNSKQNSENLKFTTNNLTDKRTQFFCASTKTE